uniref:Mucin-5AC-like isoform X2 n=1 Tax=Crassostrea virginica TaxID=6565 RepID=A0A8B8EW83_CRAVI|nr:mucin-5AC-like isoform X2 [Crassostrea virginica]
MAQLKRFTSIANDEEEVHSFTNPAYHVTSDDPEDLEQKWQTQDEEEIFKPPPQRCTMFNVAVALFILAAGGLAVVLIIKMSEDNYSVQTTPRPVPLKTSPHTTVSTSQSTTNPKDTTTTSGMRTTTMTSTVSDRQTTRSSTSRPTSTTITSRTTTTETLSKSTTVTTGSPITTSSSTTTTSEATTSTTVATTTTERSTSTAPSTTTVLSTAMPSITTTTTSTIPPSTTTKTTSTLPPSTTTTSAIPPSTTTKATSTIPPSTTTKTTSTLPPSTTTTSTIQPSTTTKATSTILPSTTTTSTIPPLTTTTSTIPPSTTTTSTIPPSTTTVASSPGQSPATTTTTTITTTITTTNQTTLQPQTSTRTATMLTTASTSKAAIENTTLIPQTTSTSTEASKPPTTLSTTTQTSTYQPTMTKSTTSTSTTIQSSMNTSKTSPPELSSTASSTSISNTSISTTIVPSSSTLGAVNHTTGDPINSTETGGLTFEASLKVTSITWSDDYQNTTSEAYQELVSNFTHQVEDAIQSSEVGESFSHVSVESVRPGSVVFDFRVVMKTSAYRVNESQAIVTPSVVRWVLVTAVQNAKNSGSQLLLSGVDVNNISVVVATLTTQSTPSTMPSTAVSNMKTTASTQQPTVAMTTIPNNTTVSPCTDMDYLRNTLLSHCLDVTQMNVVASSNSQDEKCQFVLAAVDCILQKIAADFEVTCSEEHKRGALVGFSDIIQSYIAIDPVTCLMTTLTSTPTVKNSTNTTSSTISHSTTSVTRTTAIAQTTASSTKPRKTVAMTTTPHNKTVSPCTDMDYLRSTLLSHCLNVTQMNVVASSNSQDEKCQFVLAAVDCILQKITVDFEVTCSEEHKRGALFGFSDIIQSYLAIDPVTCLMTTLTSTPTVKNSTNTPSSTTLSTSLSATTTAITQTTASSTKPRTTVAMTTTPHNKTVSPCTDMDYLRDTLLSHCLDVTQMNVVASSNSQDEKCQFVLAGVDCILQKITADFEVTCSEEHKRSALVGFSDIIQSYLAIDPVTCLESG